MNVTINFNLSEKGQKASLLAGGSGQRGQKIEVAPDHPLFAAALEQASIAADGSATLDQTGYNWEAYNHTPSVEELLGAKARREAAKKAEADAKAENQRLATQTVLDGRQTRREIKTVGELRFEFFSPDWPYQADEAVTNSPEAVAWRAELDCANAAQATTYQAVLAVEKQAEQAERDAKEAARLAKRAELGLDEGEVIYHLENGCLAAVPCWSGHNRSKNWMAIISVDPHAPGGLARHFQVKAKGDLYYSAENLTPGTPVEFGADYYSGSGRKSPNRWYGIVTRRVTYRPGTDEATEYVVFVAQRTGKSAIKAAEKLRASLKTTETDLPHKEIRSLSI